MGLRTIEVIIPHANDRHDHRQIFLQGGLLEVFVHSMRTLEQFLKVIVTNNERDAQADRAP